jgi:hypothetical protein
MGSLAGGDDHEDVFEHIIRRKHCQRGKENVTASRIVNVTATVCLEWKNGTDCAHLTFPVLWSLTPTSDTCTYIPQIPEAMRRF